MGKAKLTVSSKTKLNVAVAYVRVSTEEQANEGVSLEAQEHRIRAYCELRGLICSEVIIDAGVSAGKPLATRDGGARLLGLVKAKKVGAVVALKLDRLFRNCADCLSVVEGWDKAGVGVHLVDLGGQAVNTSSAMGRFFLTVMAGAAELERNQVRERTSIAMQQLAANGRYTGGNAKFGFKTKADGSLHGDDTEHAVIARVRDARASGHSLRKIVRDLEAEGVRSRSGKPLALTQVARIARAA
jgi:DNA invertase Pin-like site-specific DNA recombinase